MKEKNKFQDKQLYTLDSLGVVVAREIVPRKIVTQVNSIIDSNLGSGRFGKFSIMEMGEIFFELMALPWVINAGREILGPNFRYDHSFGLQQPGEGVFPNLHGGPLSSQGCNYYVSNAGVIRCGRISVGISLSYQNSETGGFAYIPGSHKSAFNNPGIQIFGEMLNKSFKDDCITIPTLNPGDVCLFVDGLVHGTTNWAGMGYRRSLYYMYSPGFASWRPYSQIEKYYNRATTEIQRTLLQPPYVAAFDEDNFKLGSNIWRNGL